MRDVWVLQDLQNSTFVFFQEQTYVNNRKQIIQIIVMKAGVFSKEYTNVRLMLYIEIAWLFDALW